jgi:hypothetical protein
MCTQKYDVWRMVGKDIDVTAGIGEKETPFQLDSNDGDVIGISAAENYERVDLAKCLLTLEVNGDKPATSVPITQLLPDVQGQMWPYEIKAGLKVKAKIVSRSANTLVAVPITLIFHHKHPKDCK